MAQASEAVRKLRMVIRFLLANTSSNNDALLEDQDLSLVSGPATLTLTARSIVTSCMNYRSSRGLLMKAMRDTCSAKVSTKLGMVDVSSTIHQYFRFLHAFCILLRHRQGHSVLRHGRCPASISLCIYPSSRRSDMRPVPDFQVLQTLLKIIAPIVPHLAEEVYELLGQVKKSSVFLDLWQPSVSELQRCELIAR